MNRRRMSLLLVSIILVLLYGSTYLPHKIVKVTPSKVSKIVIFNGNTGYQIEINEKEDIEYIIRNLNGISFQKGKMTSGYMGYSFRTTIYNNKGKSVKGLVINTTDTVRFNGFFYKAKNNLIDYGYIESMFEKYPLKGP
ncbi:hypothetical protein [Paenibacillus sp. GXUN7292]|uniref:hypothetical protein n=1 Tax=Paenibacillus sp. GXUN7292 TaxID=3422499 RepID=UPI003D7DAB27